MTPIKPLDGVTNDFPNGYTEYAIGDIVWRVGPISFKHRTEGGKSICIIEAQTQTLYPPKENERC